MVPGVASIFFLDSLTQVPLWLVIVQRKMYAALATRLPYARARCVHPRPQRPSSRAAFVMPCRDVGEQVGLRAGNEANNACCDRL